MRLSTLLTAAGLLAVTALGHSQVPTAPASRPPSAIPDLPSSVPAPTPIAPLPSVAAPEQTVEQVIEALEVLKAQKAALEKREKQLAELLKQKLNAQSERVKKLGLPSDEPKPHPAPSGVIEISPRDTSPALNRPTVAREPISPNTPVHKWQIETLSDEEPLWVGSNQHGCGWQVGLTGG